MQLGLRRVRTLLGMHTSSSSSGSSSGAFSIVLPDPPLGRFGLGTVRTLKEVSMCIPVHYNT
jgi:hypothetical protein